MFDWLRHLWTLLFHRPEPGEVMEPIHIGVRGFKSRPGYHQQDIGKFMKHGRQSSYYRATVKAKVSPEEEEDN